MIGHFRRNGTNQCCKRGIYGCVHLRVFHLRHMDYFSSANAINTSIDIPLSNGVESPPGIQACVYCALLCR